jgi:DNA-binding transcriptional regulator YdaS (Cro superfamily)
MDELIDYLNSLAPEGRQAFLDLIDTTENYLRKQRSSGKALGVQMCVRIEEATGGKVTRQALRSDWREIWPELRPPKSDASPTTQLAVS